MTDAAKRAHTRPATTWRIVGALILLLSSLAKPAAADVATSALPTQVGEPVRYQLANGLDVVLQEMHRSPRVAVIVAYDAGQRDDPLGRSGLARLVEHMTYRGSRHLGPNDAWTVLRNLGATEVASETSLEMTRFGATIPSSALATALWVESERMAFTLERFDEASLALEKRIIESEERLQVPKEQEFQQVAMAALFGEKHPYARRRGPLNLEAIKLDEVRWFFQARYRPDQAHLIVVGDFRTAEARALISKYFGPIANPEASSPREALPERAPIVSREENVGYTGKGFDNLRAQWLVPQDAEASVLAVDLLSSVLKGRLGKVLSPADLSAKSARFELRALRLPGGSAVTLEIAMASDPRFQYIERAVLAELDQVFNTDFGSLIEDGKHRATLALLQRAESPMQLARAQLMNITLRDTPLVLSQALADIRALTVNDVLALREHFAPERRSVTRLRRYGAVPATSGAIPAQPGPKP